MARRSPKPFQRTDRIAEQVRAIVASELERIGDDRLEMVTVTDVKVDGSFDTADVYYSAFSAEDDDRLEEVVEALDDVRWTIQQVVNREVRARRTPQIRFHRDDVLLEALRIESILHDIADAPPVPPGTGGIDEVADEPTVDDTAAADAAAGDTAPDVADGESGAAPSA